MFNRPKETYEIDYSSLKPEVFLNDAANPLARIISLIPDGSRVLDIGAGNGLLGWLSSNTGMKYIIDGVEPSEKGAELARKYYRNFHCAFFQDVKEKLASENYDFVVLADVIEHISDPYQFLKDIVDFFPSTTRFILSIPNVAHGSVRLGLLNGEFTYVDSGLLEKTHLRFFTWETIRNLIEKLAVYLVSVCRLQREFLSPELLIKHCKPSLMTYYRLLKDPDALAFQYLVVLSKTELKPVHSAVGYSGISLPGFLLWRFSRFFPFNFLYKWMTGRRRK